MNLVQKENKELLTNSIVFAKKFKKPHSDILKEIKHFKNKLYFRDNFRKNVINGKIYYKMTEHGMHYLLTKYSGAKNQKTFLKFSDAFDEGMRDITNTLLMRLRCFFCW